MTEPTPDPGTKVCPRCAEEVKAAALVCRFCRFEFGPLPDATAPGPISVSPTAQPAETSTETPDSSVPRSRADLAVELAQATQQWTLPRLLGKFDATRAGLGEIADTEAVMREHGYEPGSPVQDEQGRTNITYTRAAKPPTMVRIDRGAQQADTIAAENRQIPERQGVAGWPTLQAAQPTRPLIERVRNPSLGGLGVAVLISFVPLAWPLLLYMALRYVTGHRAPRSPTRSILPVSGNGASSSPVEAATSEPSHSSSSKRVPYVAASLIAFAAFAAVAAASGWVPAVEATPVIYGPMTDKLQCEIQQSRQIEGLAYDSALLAKSCGPEFVTPARPAMAAYFDAQQANWLWPLAAGLGTFAVLLVVLRRPVPGLVAVSVGALAIGYGLAQAWVPEWQAVPGFTGWWCPVADCTGGPAVWNAVHPAHLELASFDSMWVLWGVVAAFVVFFVVSAMQANGHRPSLILSEPSSVTKDCPRCAETIKAAALVCRYCGFAFEMSAT